MKPSKVSYDQDKHGYTIFTDSSVVIFSLTLKLLNTALTSRN